MTRMKSEPSMVEAIKSIVKANKSNVHVYFEIS